MPASCIEIIGPGCSKCATLEATVRETVAGLGLACEVVKVADMGAILARGILSTPALAIDGRIVVSGRVPGRGEIEKLLTAGAA